MADSDGHSLSRMVYLSVTHHIIDFLFPTGRQAGIPRREGEPHPEWWQVEAKPQEEWVIDRAWFNRWWARRGTIAYF
jgi:hypothetical protein